MDKLGFVIMAVGASLADSDCLLIPIVVTAIGLFLMLEGSDAR